MNITPASKAQTRCEPPAAIVVVLAPVVVAMTFVVVVVSVIVLVEPGSFVLTVIVFAVSGGTSKQTQVVVRVFEQ